jgi:predicted AlkP superfamily phosphohydrolase/phosphomutase
MLVEIDPRGGEIRLKNSYKGDKEEVSLGGRRRVVVIGLDGGTLDLVRVWASEGRLPHMARVMKEGCAAVCRTTFPPVTASAWNSFMTGSNPGKHGLVDFMKRRSGSYEFAPVSSSDRRLPSLWGLLSQGGKRVCVLNVPMTYPLEPVNGVMVSGLMTPGEDSDFVHPRSFTPELHRIADGYRIYAGSGAAAGDMGDLMRRVRETTEKQFRAVRHLLTQDVWDFFMYVFQGTDQLQHSLWHLMDPSHPRHIPAHPLEHAIRDFYVEVDERIGWIMGQLGDGDLLLIMSDHGAGPLHQFLHLNQWLLGWGMLRLKNGPASRVRLFLHRLGLTPLEIYNRLLLGLGLGRLKEKARMGKGGWLRPFFLSFRDVDWSRTMAYSVGNIGQLYLNVRDREPEGIVDKEAQGRQVRENLKAMLLGIRDPLDGKRLVQKVIEREEVFSGPLLEEMPDLLVFPNGFEVISFGDYEFASRHRVEAALGITGSHRMEGLFMAWGSELAACGGPSEMTILDIAPTILSYLGQPVPEWMDGRVLQERFLPGALVTRGSNPVNDAPRGDASDAYTEEEKEALKTRLRSLGYLG